MRTGDEELRGDVLCWRGSWRRAGRSRARAWSTASASRCGQPRRHGAVSTRSSAVGWWRRGGRRRRPAGRPRRTPPRLGGEQGRSAVGEGLGGGGQRRRPSATSVDVAGAGCGERAATMPASSCTRSAPRRRGRVGPGRGGRRARGPGARRRGRPRPGPAGARSRRRVALGHLHPVAPPGQVVEARRVLSHRLDLVDHLMGRRRAAGEGVRQHLPDERPPLWPGWLTASKRGGALRHQRSESTTFPLSRHTRPRARQWNAQPAPSPRRPPRRSPRAPVARPRAAARGSRAPAPGRPGEGGLGMTSIPPMVRCAP